MPYNENNIKIIINKYVRVHQDDCPRFSKQVPNSKLNEFISDFEDHISQIEYNDEWLTVDKKCYISLKYSFCDELFEYIWL